MIATLVLAIALDDASFFVQREAMVGASARDSDGKVVYGDYHRFDGVMDSAIDNWKLSNRHRNNKDVRAMVLGWHNAETLEQWGRDMDARANIWFEIHQLSYMLTNRGVTTKWVHDDGRMIDDYPSDECPPYNWRYVCVPRRPHESVEMILKSLNNLRSMMGEEAWNAREILDPLPVYKTRP